VSLLSDMPTERLGASGSLALLNLMTDHLIDNPKATASSAMTDVLTKAALLGGGLVREVYDNGKKQSTAGGSRSTDLECWACGGAHLMTSCHLSQHAKEVMIRARKESGTWKGPATYSGGYQSNYGSNGRGPSSYPAPPRNGGRR